MAAIIYLLCTLTCLACFGLLWRAWLASRSRLLFWSALCFLLLTANNVLLVFDKVIFPVSVDLYLWRLVAALGAVLLLLFGLVWEED